MSMNPHPSKSPPVPRSAHSPRSPPLPHFEDPPAPQDDPPEGQLPEDAPDDDEIPYPEPTSEHGLLPPNPNFRPFFTLIEDSTSGEHYHPYVHYVFADDDPVIVTAAAMRSLGLDDTKYLPQVTPDGEEKEQRLEEDEEGQDQQPPVESPLPPPIPGVKDHYLIIDLAPDGHTIEDAQSLSPEWQIAKADVRTAPSFDEGSPEGGYMLRIEGVGVPTKNKGKAKGQPGENKLKEARDRSQGDIFGALDGLMKGVEGSLEVAEKISARRDTEELGEGDPAITDDVEAEAKEKGKMKASDE